MRKLLPLTLLISMLHGCVFVPRFREHYDTKCQIVTRHAVLEVGTLFAIDGCTGDGCAAALMAAGVVSAASVVISGSIVVVANMAFWNEKRGRCKAPPTTLADWRVG